MKRPILASAFVAATFWITSTPVLAQHGGRPASPGAGAPSMHGSSASAEGSHDSSRPTTSPSSPGSVLARNPNVGPALTKALQKQGVLPNGMTVADACTNPNAKFKTLGQCIAALHIHHKFPNCGLDQLASAKSLGAGIQACRPDADAKADARNATKQAKQDMKDANS